MYTLLVRIASAILSKVLVLPWYFIQRPRLVIHNRSVVAAESWNLHDETTKCEGGARADDLRIVQMLLVIPQRRRSSSSSASLIIHLRKRPNISALWKSHLVSTRCVSSTTSFTGYSNEIWGAVALFRLLGYWINSHLQNAKAEMLFSIMAPQDKSGFTRHKMPYLKQLFVDRTHWPFRLKMFKELEAII